MKRVLCSLLVGCLVFSLAGCGETTGTESTEPTEKVEESKKPTEKVEENVSTDTVENNSEIFAPGVENEKVVTEESGWAQISEMFKPAFEAHPLFNGEVLVGNSRKEMESMCGTPDAIENDTYLVYTLEKSDGTSIEARFKYLPNVDRVAALNCENVNNEFFMIDNENCLITEEKYNELRAARYDELGEKREMTYEDVVKIFGTPGYIDVITSDHHADRYSGIDYIRIVWAYPKSENPSDYDFAEISFDADGEFCLLQPMRDMPDRTQ